MIVLTWSHPHLTLELLLSIIMIGFDVGIAFGQSDQWDEYYEMIKESMMKGNHFIDNDDDEDNDHQFELSNSYHHLIKWN